MHNGEWYARNKVQSFINVSRFWRIKKWVLKEREEKGKEERRQKKMKESEKKKGKQRKTTHQLFSLDKERKPSS